MLGSSPDGKHSKLWTLWYSLLVFFNYVSLLKICSLETSPCGPSWTMNKIWAEFVIRDIENIGQLCLRRFMWTFPIPRFFMKIFFFVFSFRGRGQLKVSWWCSEKGFVEKKSDNPNLFLFSLSPSQSIDRAIVVDWEARLHSWHSRGHGSNPSKFILKKLRDCWLLV